MTFSRGLQVGGGVTADTASEFLDAGASHVIVTSWVFTDGKIVEERLKQLVGFQIIRHHTGLCAGCSTRNRACMWCRAIQSDTASPLRESAEAVKQGKWPFVATGMHFCPADPM